MKKFIFSIVLCLLSAANIMAIPAYPRPVRLSQPDGTFITIVGHGDEFCNYITTIDGYTIVKGEDDFYHYARLESGNLVATDIRAHEPEARALAEREFIGTISKNIVPAKKTSLRRLAPLDAERHYLQGEETTDDKPLLANKAGMMNSKFRGLVILVNFTDRKWRLGNVDAKAYVKNMMNKEGWTSYKDGTKTVYTTGSVHDYFSDNSYGMFAPEFDVIGPVTINRASTYPSGSDNSAQLTYDVLNAVDSQVDFKQYDADGDGYVDMFYVIYAGYAASFSGNNSKYLWPHATSMSYYRISMDGVKLGRYACSTELYGWESQGNTELNGIGVICHEFSHVLGYADHYDTAYKGYKNPGEWDVMAGGSYNGSLSNCPAGYSAYERLTGGFLTPTLLTKADDGKTLSMKNLEDAPDAYRINTPVRNEFFLLENRQKVKWDKQLPGHGMLLWRVDSTDVSVWSRNSVNSQARSYLELVGANGGITDGTASGADSYPGTKRVTMISNTTSPANLLTYNKSNNDLAITDITESNKVISFTIEASGSNGPDLPEGVVFYESFDKNAGTGGNDGVFGTKQVTAQLVADYAGWDYTTGYGLNKCARFGSSATTPESVGMPAFELESGKNYIMTFKAAPYYTDGTALTLSVGSGNATMLNLDDAEQTSATKSLALTTTTNQWTEYRIRITGSGEQKLKFVGATTKSKRFLLDEVKVELENNTAIDEIHSAAPTASQVYYNLQGQRVNNDYRGIVIVGGKKVYNK